MQNEISIVSLREKCNGDEEQKNFESKSQRNRRNEDNKMNKNEMQYKINKIYMELIQKN
ncbi:unnamed protein product [Paramecium sonneborni]|uniref:Uncharacterized protein n=1 Tax=Paramecium sonneborni TaxID=65129 RepID=A0A8S1KF90_9CILI|nr:unnamed protein product [Paramecium sonneborni]